LSWLEEPYKKKRGWLRIEMRSNQQRRDDKERIALVTFLRAHVLSAYPNMKSESQIMATNYHLDNMDEPAITLEELDIMTDVMIRTNDLLMRLKHR
jgi:hypothetical protein